MSVPSASRDFPAFLQQLAFNEKLFEKAPRKIIWLSGAPGAGKGTNERYIIEHEALCPQPLVASSFLNTPEMQRKINQGLLLDDQTVVSAVFKALINPIYRNGVLVDGFPRTPGQAESVAWLYDRLIEQKFEVHFSIIILMLEEEESIRRQLHRGQSSLKHNEKVKNTGTGNLKEVRSTDLDPKIARQRYEQFMTITYAALENLKHRLPFATISTQGTFDAVKTRLIEELDRLKF